MIKNKIFARYIKKIKNEMMEMVTREVDYCLYLQKNVNTTLTFDDHNFPVKPLPRIECEENYSCHQKNIPCKHAFCGVNGNEFLRKYN